MIKNNKKSDSDSIENLLFNGLIYGIISEPDALRESMLDMDVFLDTTKSLDFDKKVKKIKSAMQTVDRIKDRDGAFSAFEAFLENSRYCLIIVDQKFNHIFHNQKSDGLIKQLFSNAKEDNQKHLKNKLVEKIVLAKTNSNKNAQRLITIPNAINGNISAYLISNNHKLNEERNFNILLIPDFETHKSELPGELVNKFKISNKERKILSALIAGSGVQQISEQFCISLNTVRSHLKSIFRKTSTKSQSDLICLFLNHESQYLDSYFEPVKPAFYFDAQSASEDLFITLSTDNKICYREYGPKEGRPIVILHNFFGSRFHIPYGYSEILHKTNRRIIIPERPGYGQSDVFPNYYEHWSEMLNEFIDKLGIPKPDLLGNISASALAVKHANDYSEMINSVILTSPLFINSADQKTLLGELPYNCSRMVAVSKRLAGNAFRLWTKSMKFDTERYIRRMIKQYAGRNEIHALDDQDYIDRLVLNFTESQRNNSNGSAQDAVSTLLPLDLDLTKITVPFHIWIGDEDSLISVTSAKEICAPLPNKKFHVRKGYGEEIYYHLFEEIIQ